GVGSEVPVEDAVLVGDGVRDHGEIGTAWVRDHADAILRRRDWIVGHAPETYVGRDHARVVLERLLTGFRGEMLEVAIVGGLPRDFDDAALIVKIESVLLEDTVRRIFELAAEDEPVVGELRLPRGAGGPEVRALRERVRGGGVAQCAGRDLVEQDAHLGIHAHADEASGIGCDGPRALADYGSGARQAES